MRRMPRASDKQRIGGLIDTLAGCRCQPQIEGEPCWNSITVFS